MRLDGGAIVAAFEIESATSIYSGLLRMSDLLARQPTIWWPSPTPAGLEAWVPFAHARGSGKFHESGLAAQVDNVRNMIERFDEATQPIRPRPDRHPRRHEPNGQPPVFLRIARERQETGSMKAPNPTNCRAVRCDVVGSQVADLGGPGQQQMISPMLRIGFTQHSDPMPSRRATQRF